MGLWDLNGDGKLDLVLGASRAEGPALGVNDNRGEVYILFGRPNFPPLVDLAGLAGPEADVRISGADSGDQLSRDNALQAADVTGDGLGDLILAARLADGPGGLRSNAGEV
ncbi:MAG: FG-GAP repeat protein [Verrucomicrobiae bacterium]|nr:FG-GAP repeat protein [Verrucomicrobiae bacterium]